MEVDGTSCVPIEAGIEQLRWVVQRGALRERHLDHALVGLARADHAVAVPNGHAPPLPLLLNRRHGILDQGAEPGQQSAPPIPEFRDFLIDQLGWGLFFQTSAPSKQALAYSSTSR
jgi:hypothetical protein